MWDFNDDPAVIAQTIAQRVRARRLEANLTQRGMARRAGLATATYRRFESTAQVSLNNLILIAVALGATDDFATLFQRPAYASIDEVISAQRPTRRRGRHD